MVNVNVHGSVQGADQGGLVGPQSLVSSVNGFGLPVGPVDVLLEQGHGENVRDVVAEHCGTKRHMFYSQHDISDSCCHIPNRNCREDGP